MVGLLIAAKDAAMRKQVADLFIEEGYDVTVTSSAAKAIENVIKKTAQVLLLGTELDMLTTAELLPLLKKCNRKIIIILVAGNVPLPLIRKFREEGIFYHALPPVEAEAREEIRQVVKCACHGLSKTPDVHNNLPH